MEETETQAEETESAEPTEDVTTWTDEKIADFGKQPEPEPEQEAKQPEPVQEQPKQEVQRPVPPPITNQLPQIQQRKDWIIQKLNEIKQIDPTDQMVNDPQSFRETLTQQIRLEHELRELGTQEAAAEMMKQASSNQQQIHLRKPDFIENLPDIVAAAIEAGEPQNMVDQLKTRPYSVNPAAVLYYGAKAELKKAQVKHAAEVAELKAEHEKFLKQLQTTTGKNTVTNAGKGAQIVDFKSITARDIETMSDEDLQQFRKVAYKR